MITSRLTLEKARFEFALHFAHLILHLLSSVPSLKVVFHLFTIIITADASSEYIFLINLPSTV